MPLRPPWALHEPGFSAACTGCRACVEACPEHVLAMGRDGLPVFQPDGGECTFCRRCVDACQPQALLRTDAAPWRHRARIAGSCLPAHGVVCTSCGDVCPEAAIRIPPAARGGAQVAADRCTGCGACVGVCPVQAIGLAEPAEEAA